MSAHWRHTQVNPLFTDEYQAIVQLLVSWRAESGLTQRGLSAVMGRAESHVALIEKGQRRVDTLELHRYVVALGRDPAEAFAHVAEAIGKARDKGGQGG